MEPATFQLITFFAVSRSGSFHISAMDSSISLLIIQPGSVCITEPGSIPYLSWPLPLARALSYMRFLRFPCFLLPAAPQRMEQSRWQGRIFPSCHVGRARHSSPGAISFPQKQHMNGFLLSFLIGFFFVI